VSSHADHQPNHVPPWSQADARAVDLIRVLVMDVAEQAGSGHPGDRDEPGARSPGACVEAGRGESGESKQRE
jgi:hypothetical protein